MNNDDREILDDFEEFDDLLSDANLDNNSDDFIKNEEDNNFNIYDNNIDNFENPSNTNIEEAKELSDDLNESPLTAENIEEISEDSSNKENTNVQEKKELENPIVEAVNNKTTMKLIVVMLVVLFLAVIFMPTVISYIKDLIER